MSFDYSVPATGHNALSDIEQLRENFLKLLNCHKSASEPPLDPTHSHGMLWLYTPATGNWILRQRNKDNNGWINLWELTATGVPSAHFALSTATTTVHGARQGSGNGFDADKVDGNHFAPNVTSGGLLTKNGLKVSTGSASGSSDLKISIVMQDYCFFPNIYTQYHDTGSNRTLSGYQSNIDDYVGRICLLASGVSDSYAVRWRYITSSDKPFIYVIKKNDDEILGVWECDDPPPGYWGLSQKPADFIPPILFGKNDANEIQELEEIVLFNYPKDYLNDLRERARGEKKDMASLLRQYDFDHMRKIFLRRNLSQI